MKGKWGRIVLACLVLAAAWWAAVNLRLVKETGPAPLGFKAMFNPLYATERLLHHLGANVHRHLQRDEPLPPVSSTVVLSSASLSEQRDQAQRLRPWVEQGGHLVLSHSAITHDSFEWVPVSNAGGKLGQEQCQRVEKHESQGMAPAPSPSPFELCAPVSAVLKVTDPDAPLWTVSAQQGDIIMRVRVGVGTVTVHGIPAVFDNRALPKADHAHLAALILRAGAGQEVLFIEEGRPPGPDFWSWLWDEAWVALVLALGAVALGLWRGARRWGPLMGEAQPVRRSMAEQIHGTAQFLANHGRQALHQSAQRALDEAARQRLYCFDQLTVKDRAKVIAEHTGLPASALAQAMLPPGPGRRAATGQSLQLLEVARRRLRGHVHRPLHSPPHIPTSEGDLHADPH